MFVTPTNFVGLESNAEHRGRDLARQEVSQIVALAREIEPAEVRPGNPLERVMSAIAEHRRNGFEPSVLFIPISAMHDRNLGLELSRGSGIDDWWDVLENRAILMDLAMFCDIREGTSDDGVPDPPETSIREVDEALAAEILMSWTESDDPAVGETSVLDLMTRVNVRIGRRFEVVVSNRNAAILIDIEASFTQ